MSPTSHSPNEFYFHINNGGTAFKVDNRETGALLVVSANHFGVKTNQMEILIVASDLRESVKFFERTSDAPLQAHRYNPVHTRPPKSNED